MILQIKPQELVYQKIKCGSENMLVVFQRSVIVLIEPLVSYQ